ncbi:MAG: ferrous iron transporter B [Clostridia bacterium]|nr:ferrous iron transporter B [Clostridia bacterium]
MGLTHKSTGRHLKESTGTPQRKSEDEIIIALAGNPNVGKSTLFNELTGMHQHTGNWSGKTVEYAEGVCRHRGREMRIIDLPGTYSLTPHSAEEAVADEFISSAVPDCVAVVCDATCLERNLILVLQTMRTARAVVVCVNLMDEAKKKGIHIDTELLSDMLGVPVIGISARSRDGISEVLELFAEAKKLKPSSFEFDGRKYTDIAEEVCRECVTREKPKKELRDRRIDKILTGKVTGFPIMFLMLSIIFWITIEGANYPSELLSGFFFYIEEQLLRFMSYIGSPEWLTGLLVLGIWRTLAWVVAVMLPPMAIFFPLFTLLEDLGYLPRVAFNLDRCFKRCDACGKQALTMCMGFGCNAAGVVGCRIIDSKRERLIAMLTNVFVPCNGRFPTIIALISIFFVTVSGVSGSLLSALILSAVIIFGILLTFFASKLLSLTLLRGTPSSFTLELPPYRAPQVGKVIIRSVLDRTLYVLGRAAAVAAPAGLIIWLFANVEVGGLTLLRHCTDFLNPLASIMGLDGVILFAFILALPANEIVLPIILMAYSSSGALIEYSGLAELGTLLRANGWNALTALCVIIFMLCHFPCSTTLITIKKESGSLSWAVFAAILPTIIGILLCIAVTAIARILL